MTVHRTIQLDEALDARLQSLADAANVSAEDMALRVLTERLDYDRWFIAEVQKGIDEVKAGRFYTHEEVMERSAKRREELLARDRS